MTEQPVHDFAALEPADDPVCAFGRLREEGPLVRVRMPGSDEAAWMVTRYEDVRSVLGDPRLVKDRRNVPGAEGPSVGEQLMTAFGLPPEYRAYMDTMLLADGETHGRLRKLVSRAFTARRTAALRPKVEAIVEELLAELGDGPDGTTAGRTVDLLHDFCFPLSGTVICELVGVDPADRASWLRWIRQYSMGDPELMATALRAMVEQLRSLIDHRRTEPSEDLISGLIEARDGQERLSEAELIGMILLLVQAGHHTTAHFVAEATIALLRHPEQLAALRAEPDGLPRAVHELLRTVGPVPTAALCYAVEDLEIHGVRVRKGETVICSLTAANHDPRKFDDPERLDLRRDPGRAESHLAFSHGPHYCLGAALARLESTVALDRLLLRRTDLRLAVPEHRLEYRSVAGARVLESLPVVG